MCYSTFGFHSHYVLKIRVEPAQPDFFNKILLSRHNPDILAAPNLPKNSLFFNFKFELPVSELAQRNFFFGV